VYTPGSTLQGQISLELAKPMQMRGIHLQFVGGADVGWSEQHTTGSGKNQQTVNRNYMSNERYFDHTLTLYGNGWYFNEPSGASGTNPVHPAGRYQYPFHYILPQNLPSSFEGAFGSVCYWLKGTIDVPHKSNYKYKLAYTVLSSLDLNTRPNVRDPQSDLDYKNLCCCCCKSGPISAELRIDRSGYVPGEFIVLSGEVINGSNSTMKDNRVKLRMYTTFHATEKYRTETETISSMSKGKIKAGKSAVWNGEMFHIPPLPPSELANCSIIDIMYTIVLVVDPPGLSSDLEVPLEICIGTIPL
ncbi:hypothetical protein CAPTEDRAFT_84449, partial [Capitella teleta]